MPKQRIQARFISGLRQVSEETRNDVLQHAINDVYVVNNGEKEYLIPSIEKFVPTIDLEENKMIINPIKGMLD